MKAIYHSKYNTVNKNNVGIVMFRYIVKGTAEELSAYEAAQGEYLRKADDGQPYFFTPNWTGDNVTLGITSKGKVFVDTANIDKASSLINRYPGLLGQEIAKLAAAQLLGNIGSGRATTAPAAAQPEDAAGESDATDALDA